MSLFGFGKKSILGIDVGTAAIKIVELSKDSNRFKLENYGIFQLESTTEALSVPTTPTSGGKVAQLSDDDIAWGIKELLRQMQTKSRDVIASIQSYSTFSTVVTMPYLSQEDLAKTIPFEARKYVPIPLSEVVLDWSIINLAQPTPATPAPAQPGQPPVSAALPATPTVEIYLVAVPKVETMRYQTIMKNSGLTLKALELENSALIRGVIGNDLNPYTIVNIGGRSTSIVIVDAGVERVSHNYEVGGFEITQAIARSLNVSLKRAEELKRSFGLKEVDNNVINKVMSSLLDMIVFETKKTIHNYEELRQRKMAQVLLVGGMANMPRFIEYFGEKLGLPVLPGNPLARIVVPPALEPVRAELSSTFAIALGLAMRQL